MRIALGQLNATVGDLAGNVRRMSEFAKKASREQADLVLFPELSVVGYPPEDLLFKSSFVDANLKAIKELARASRGIAIVAGFIDRDRQGRIYNAAAFCRDGAIERTYRKMMLPNYGVFDEKRYFSAGEKPLLIHFNGVRMAITICEDIWRDEGPLAVYAGQSPDLILNLSASPYHAGKLGVREKLLFRRAREVGAPIVYVNLVGGQDELVFDGASMAVDEKGAVRVRGRQCAEDLLTVDLPMTSTKQRVGRPLPLMDEVYEALLLGARDYVSKNGFSHVVVGMSGGIDSALVAALAVDALGADRVTAVSMPSQYNSSETRRDAREVSKRLGIQFLTIPITPLFQAYQSTLKGSLGRDQNKAAVDLTLQNLQARIRGTLLMALSNRYGWLVFSTGNKSEISTGYCTLYGDMVGGFAVLKDVPKTWVYGLAEVVNRRAGTDVIPRSVIRRVPSAELKPHQKDQDTLPPYPVLDRIVKAYVEEDRPVSALRRIGSRSVVSKVLRMIDTAEYKRRQAPPGVKITPRAFGRDRRMPITNRYREAGI